MDRGTTGLYRAPASWNYISSSDEERSRSFSKEPKPLSASSSWKSWITSSNSKTAPSVSLWRSWTGLSKSGTISENDPSRDPACNHGWKPHTMRKRVLLPLALWTLAMAGLIEFLAQKSVRKGGLSLSPTVGDIPNLATFGYMFLPTIIAVIYSIVWNWVDLDVKRMQPWLELSRDQGAKSTETLALDYPYDFVALVPFKAAKRRHWAVFISGTAIVVIFWVITPLQGAVFGTGPVDLRLPASFRVASDLIPVEQQAKAIDTSLLQTMYAIEYLDQPYPPFTTAEYALRPFELEPDSSTNTKNWTASTTKYWSDLECWPAEFNATYGDWNEGFFDYYNGMGCNASNIATTHLLLSADRYVMQYLGWHNSAHADQYIERLTCTEEFKHQFLAFIARKDGNDSVITAAFCETSYWQQEVLVTLPNDSLHPYDASITPTGPVEELQARKFNTSGLEFLLGSSVSAVQQVGRDWPNNRIVDHSDKVNGTGLTTQFAPMVGFVASNHKGSIEDFFDWREMEKGYRAVHKSIFALAYSSLLTTATASNETVEGFVDVALHGVLVSRTLATIVEALLLAIGLCVILLVILGRQMPSKLAADPATLGDLMEVLQNSPELLDEACWKGHTQSDARPVPDEASILSLRCGCWNSLSATAIQRLRSSDVSHHRDDAASAPHKRKDENPKTVKPVIFKRSMGSMFTVFLVATLTVLIVLRLQEQKLGGLPRPTDRFEVLQLLENYLPTAIATLIEPYWVLLNRLYCVFQPFHDLWERKGMNYSKRAVKARYASRPPQLSMLSAARSGHLLLATVSCIALLSNVLAVGLGGLLNEQSVEASYQVELQYLHSTDFDAELSDLSGSAGRKDNFFFILKANASLGTPMPPWVGDEYYFQQFGLRETARQSSMEAIHAETRGFGAEITCEPVKHVALAPDVLQVDLRDFYARHSITGTGFRCGNFHNDTIRTAAEGPLALEGGEDLCEQAVLLSWGRTNSERALEDAEVEYYACYPKLKSALFNVTVDAEGHILSYSRVSDFEIEPAAGVTEEILKFSMGMITNGGFGWHNTTFSTSWPWDIIKTTEGTRLLDPLEPMPDVSEVLPLLEGVWRRSFAALLGSRDAVRYKPVADPEDGLFTGTAVVSETRIFMSASAFYISAVILGLDILVAVAVYGFSLRFSLPRMPTSLAAMLEFVAPSRFAREDARPSETTLGFGAYIGRDGKKHVGIEYAELIVSGGNKPEKLWNVGGARRRRADNEPPGSQVREKISGNTV